IVADLAGRDDASRTIATGRLTHVLAQCMRAENEVSQWRWAGKGDIQNIALLIVRWSQRLAAIFWMSPFPVTTGRASGLLRGPGRGAGGGEGRRRGGGAGPGRGGRRRGRWWSR